MEFQERDAFFFSPVSQLGECNFSGFPLGAVDAPWSHEGGQRGGAVNN